MHCGFCGSRFDIASAEEVCSSCPIATGCQLVRCPVCGYEMPPEASLITVLRNLRKANLSETGNGGAKSNRQETPEKVALSLAEFETGIEGEISHLETTHTTMLRKLIAMNLLPGEKICLLSRSPSFLVESDYSQFAIDRDLAKRIFVKRIGAINR